MNKSKLQQSIWKHLDDGNWKLLFNGQENEDKTDTFKMGTDNVKFGSSNKVLKMGSLVMTPKGLGLLIKLENDKATVKFTREDKVFELAESLVLAEFPVYVKTLNFDFVNCFKLFVPSNGDINSLKKLIEQFGLVDVNICDYSLIYNGSEIKDYLTFEQLNVKSEDKFLLSGMKKIEFKLSRYDKVYDFWYCNPDAVVFSTSKKIKLSGVGLYLTMDGEKQNGTISICEVEGESRSRRRRGRGRRNTNTEEDNYMEMLIMEQEVNVPCVTEVVNNAFRINFDKPVTIKPFHDYKIEFTSTASSETWYGEGGKATMEGEKNVEFYFKKSSYDSSATAGNFPDFYYYV